MTNRPGEFKNVLGTIIRCALNSGNPAEDHSEEPLFYGTYEEVIVISTGINKEIPVGRWRIRLVTYRDRSEHPPKMGKHCTFIGVEPDSMILGIETLLENKELAIKLSLHSYYSGTREEVLLCGENLIPNETRELVSK